MENNQDPFANEDPFAKGGDGGAGQTPPNVPNDQKVQIPNSTAVLVLGILSIVFAFCYGIVGIILGIIALVISKKPMEEWKANPDRFQSPGNIKAGRVCAIIGLSLGGLYLLFVIIYVVILGAAVGGAAFM